MTGDDTSLALVGIGFKSFGQFKTAMTNQSVSDIKKFGEIETKIERQKNELAKLQKEYEQAIKNGWENYKKKYMKYINEENDANA